MTLAGLPGPDSSTLPVRLDRFQLEVEGNLNFDPLQFVVQTDLEPTLTIGDLVLTKDNPHVALTFTDDQGDLSVDLDGPVELGLKGLKFDPISTGFGFTLGKFDHGKYIFEGTCAGFDLAVDLKNADVHNADAGASFDSAPSGRGQICFDQQTGQTSFDLKVTFGFHFHVGDTQTAGLRVDGAPRRSTWGVTLGPDFEVVDHHAGLTATARAIAVGLGDPGKRLVELAAHSVQMDFTDPAEPLVDDRRR